jgi:hypothetical protein
MAEANLKGCHPIQNMGAVQTYSRRYLYVSALEIVEHDALDATTGSEAPKSAKPITKDVFDSMNEEDQESLRSYAMHVKSYIYKNKLEDAVLYKKSLNLDADLNTAFWSLFEPSERSALKKTEAGINNKSI